ncbi:MAG TPA: transcription antitermination factor NusB, partial [Thioalkalivibrio sp.]|nr:transcription antitermination factor NusB [Thioalkalivibrio sp.]
MDKARKLAGEILSKITREGAYSGAVLDSALFSAELDPRDKGFVTELVYGTLARLYSIDRILETYSKVKLSKMEDIVLSQLRLAVYQLRYLDRVPDHAVVSEAVTIVRKKSPKAAGFVNGMLRSILREDKTIAFKTEEERVAFDVSLKPELVRHFKKEFPLDYESVLADLIQAEGICIRVNERKISAKAFRDLLSEAGHDWRDGWFSEQFLHLSRQGALRDLPGYQAGYFSVQNESAALPPMILSRLVPEGVMLDLCAAPGGKSAYLAEVGGDKMSITAFDLAEHKLIRMKENFDRLGLSIETRAADASVFLPELEGSADGILLDVPCSGLGLLGRKPDI